MRNQGPVHHLLQLNKITDFTVKRTRVNANKLARLGQTIFILESFVTMLKPFCSFIPSSEKFWWTTEFFFLLFVHFLPHLVHLWFIQDRFEVSNLIFGVSGHPQLIPSGLNKTLERMSSKQDGKKDSTIVIHWNMFGFFYVLCFQFEKPLGIQIQNSHFQDNNWDRSNKNKYYNINFGVIFG